MKAEKETEKKKLDLEENVTRDEESKDNKINFVNVQR